MLNESVLTDHELQVIEPNLDLEDYTINNRIGFLSNFNDIVASYPLTNTENDKLMSKVSTFLQEDKDQRRLHLARTYNFMKKRERVNSEELDVDDFNIRYGKLELSKAVLCGTCLRIKVERSHHCRQCGKCVLKMDHHCPWLANCVGYRNYKYFLLIDLYGIIGLVIILASYWEAVVGYNISNTASLGLAYIVTFSYVSGLALLGFLIWLTVINWRLALQNQTVIENADKERFPSSKSVNIYDLGLYKNFVHVFGRNPLYWFLPFNANYDGQGLIFEKIDDGYY